MDHDIGDIWLMNLGKGKKIRKFIDLTKTDGNS